ncbi:MAG: hypothetical protein AAB654_13835 [Acidobacteriota bacterium]
MLSPTDSQAALAKFFRQQRVATLETLYAILHTSSRMSVYRRLSALDYLTSYSHTGRYYTQAAIPEFDTDGLWHYQGVLFSRHGSLKNTVEHLVRASDMGRTHAELYLRLRLRVHNALLDLLHHHRIGRTALGSLYLYVSTDPRTAARQLAQRKEQPEPAPTAPAAETGVALVIEVLLEVIHAAQIVPDPALVSHRLAARSVAASVQQVEDIFRSYGLKKTPASP